MTKLDHWPISKLRNHLLNIEVFGELSGDADLDEFVESVREHGILQPIVVAPDGTIISGHRRRQAAARAAIKEVPVIVHRDLKDTLDIDRAWFESNRNREMTPEQKARWFQKREAIEAEAARVREKRGTANPAQKVAQGRAPTAADIAAAEVGMSRPTAKRAARVVKAIDEAELKGDRQTAAHLRKTLNTKSVAAAEREVAELNPNLPHKMKRLDGKPKSVQLACMMVQRHVTPLFRRLDELAELTGEKGAACTRAKDLLREFVNVIGRMSREEF